METEKLCELIRKFSTAMLITRVGDADRRLRARPMALAGVEDDGTLWFLTARDTAKVHEIERDTHVHVACQDDRDCYLSINGMANVVDDRSRVDEFWKEEFKVWFPEGKDDPSVTLIAVRPTDAEYWDNSGRNKLEYLWEAAAAYISKDRPHLDEDQHGKLG